MTAMAALPPDNGPQADYPVVIGDPYTVAGTTFTPADVMNYDEVGFAAAGTGQGVTGAHHTLPVPSYVEVTSLETGRTILVRLESRGPMDSTDLVSLSPAAMAQLGASPGEAVRVRRVNPPEEQRAMLRADQLAPLRMDTPMGLVSVLRRRLPEDGSASLQVDASTEQEEQLATLPEEQVAEAAEAVAVVDTEATAVPALAPLGSPEEESFEQAFTEVDTPAQVEVDTEVAEQAIVPDTDGNFVVQAASFSTEERATRAASDLGGNVTQAGQYFRVRTGPFATRAQAEASLANVQAAGYSDARIYPVG